MRSAEAAVPAGSSRAGSAGPGYFHADSAIRRVMGERVMVLSGPRALLMQAAHPLAVAGLLAHSGDLDAPYDRLARTAEVMSTITFGSRAETDVLMRRVRRMHRRVSGRLSKPAGRYPAGTAYRADDPELLLWVLFTLFDSALVVYGRFVASPSRSDAAALWDDYRVVGERFGLDRAVMPDSLAELDAYRARMLEGDDLHVTEWARTRARSIVLEPPVPLPARPVVELVNFITIALLPDRIRAEYGFSPLPPTFVRKPLVAAAGEYVKRTLPVVPRGLRLVPQARAPG